MLTSEIVCLFYILIFFCIIIENVSHIPFSCVCIIGLSFSYLFFPQCSHILLMDYYTYPYFISSIIVLLIDTFLTYDQNRALISTLRIRTTKLAKKIQIILNYMDNNGTEKLHENPFHVQLHARVWHVLLLLRMDVVYRYRI